MLKKHKGNGGTPITVEEAGELLSIAAEEVQQLLADGVLSDIGTDKTRVAREDVESLQAFGLSTKEPTLEEVQRKALMAYARAYRLERVVEELLDFMGAGAHQLVRSPREIAYTHSTARMVARMVPSVQDLRYWTEFFMRIDERYLRTTAEVTGDEEPWKVYLDLASHLVDCLDPTHPGHQSLIARATLAKERLRQTSYFVCRELYGRELANRLFPEPRKLEQIMSTLLDHP